MTTFFFRAVASDGKLRTGSLSGENEKTVARELRKQGLTPVYVGRGAEEVGSSSSCPRSPRGRRRDILFFTQELSTLLNAGVPLDRALSITSELTERAHVPHRRAAIFCASSKAASRWPTAWRCIRSISPTCTSTWCGPAKHRARWRRLRPAGGIRALARRTAQLHHFVDDLSRRCWPAWAWAAIFVLLNFVVPRFASGFRRIAHEDSAADADHAGGEQSGAGLLVDGRDRR